MAALDLAVLLRTARADVAVANTGALDRQDEGERELGAVVGLNLANGTLLIGRITYRDDVVPSSSDLGLAGLAER